MKRIKEIIIRFRKELFVILAVLVLAFLISYFTDTNSSVYGYGQSGRNGFSLSVWVLALCVLVGIGLYSIFRKK